MAENLEKIRPALTALEVGGTVTFPHFKAEKRPHASLRTGSYL